MGLRSAGAHRPFVAAAGGGSAGVSMADGVSSSTPCIVIEHMFDNVVVFIVVILVVAALAVVAGVLMGRSQGASQLRAEQDRARRLELELRQELATSRSQVDGLERQLSFTAEQLERVRQEEAQRVQREREREAEQAERRRVEQEQSLREQGKVLAALAPVQKNLDALQQKVTQIEEGRKLEMGQLGAQLKGLSEQQSRLDRETMSLSAALRDNKVRGAWGEAQLRNIVESAGLLEHVDFDTQVVVQADGRQLRPDMVVHLPGGKSIPIDAKVPYADYQRACSIAETGSEEELRQRASLLQAHAKALREHVKTLSDRAYWQAFATAPDFVIAFIPNEALLQAALQVDPTLMDDAFAHKVALTSPVTLWAVLKSVAYAWQQQSMTDDARQLFDLSRELYERFAKLGENAVKLGSSLGRTVTAYNQFASSLESRLLVTARKLQKMDPSKVIGQVELLEGDKHAIRSLQAPELTQSIADEDGDRSGGAAAQDALAGLR